MCAESFVALDSASVALIFSHIATRVSEIFTSEADLVTLRLLCVRSSTFLSELISSLRFVAHLAVDTRTESAAFDTFFFVLMEAA